MWRRPPAWSEPRCWSDCSCQRRSGVEINAEGKILNMWFEKNVIEGAACTIGLGENHLHAVFNLQSKTMTTTWLPLNAASKLLFCAVWIFNTIRARLYDTPERYCGSRPAAQQHFVFQVRTCSHVTRVSSSVQSCDFTTRDTANERNRTDTRRNNAACASRVQGSKSKIIANPWKTPTGRIEENQIEAAARRLGNGIAPQATGQSSAVLTCYRPDISVFSVSSKNANLFLTT